MKNLLEIGPGTVAIFHGYCNNVENKGGVSFMAYVINDECINCGACEAEVPVSYLRW